MTLDQVPVEELMGKTVRVLREFPGRIPIGTMGRVTETYNKGSVMISWFDTGGDGTDMSGVKDGFGRENEQHWLEVLGPKELKGIMEKRKKEIEVALGKKIWPSKK